jgi:hypothetical protein
MHPRSRAYAGTDSHGIDLAPMRPDRGRDLRHQVLLGGITDITFTTAVLKKRQPQ